MRLFSPLLLAVVMLSAIPALAEIYPSGDWGWSDGQDGYYFAATANEATRYFGQYCYFDTGDCLYLLSSPTGCEPDAQHVGLISTDAGSVSATLVCSHEVDGNHVYIVGPFEDIDNAVRQGQRIGIVLPLQGGEFEVTRFSLIGSTKAIDAMRSAAEKKLGKTPSQPADAEIL